MKTTFLIILNKLIYIACKIFRKNGSAFPGSIIYKFDHNVLDKIKYPKYVIGVTGSSGKGSTVEIIAHILKDAGKKVVYNKSGSNGVHGLISLILNNSTLNHQLKGDILLLELDEKQIKYDFHKDALTHLVVTNITRDQPARNIHVDEIYNDIFDYITDYTHLIINADDPIINKIKLSHKGKITTYGVAKTKDSRKTPGLENMDHAYCPVCNRKLKYDYYHYGQLGKYFCPKCDYQRGKIDYEANGVDLENKVMKINKDVVKLNKDIFYAIYYTLAAYSVTAEIGIKKDQILYALNEDMITAKRGKVYALDNRNVNMLESKNENAVSYYQSLKYIMDQKGTKTVILGFENVSRRYKYNDLSWLWDVEFELLNQKDIDRIICIGRFKYDVANRLIYAGVSENKLVLIDDLNNLVETTKKQSKGEIFTMVCFDMSEIIKNLLQEGSNGNN